MESQLKFLVNYAVLAPSVHNTQPWLFRVLDHTIEIYANRSRALAVVDPDDRSLIISCGSCVHLFTRVLNAFRMEHKCSVFPDMADPDLMARITVTSSPKGDPDEALVQAIVRRSTIRRGFQSLPLPEAFIDWFTKGNDERPDFIRTVMEKESEFLILRQLQETERNYQSDKRYRRETESWTHPLRERSQDGIPMNPDEPTTMVSCWSVDNAPDHATMLAVLTEPADTPRAWLETGEHLIQVLLEASRMGLNAAIMNLPSTSTDIRSMIKPLIGFSGDPILLLRFGRPRRKLITPRRSTVDVMLHPGFRH